MKRVPNSSIFDVRRRRRGSGVGGVEGAWDAGGELGAAGASAGGCTGGIARAGAR
jgi:hypothetical protein